MFGSTMFETFIGLALMYAMLALVCSALTEVALSATSVRAKFLCEWIVSKVAVHADGFYSHPLATLRRAGEKPSYIQAQTFSAIALDLLLNDKRTEKARAGVADQFDRLRQSVKGIAATHPALSPLEAIVDKLVDEAALKEEYAMQRLTLVRQGIERWYDDSMDRLGGWVKRSARKWSVGIAFALCLLTNADTLHVARSLSQDSKLRSELYQVAVAEVTKRDGSSPLASNCEPSNSIAEAVKTAEADGAMTVAAAQEKLKQANLAARTRTGKPAQALTELDKSVAAANEALGTAETNAATSRKTAQDRATKAVQCHADLARATYTATLAKFPIGYSAESVNHPWSSGSFSSWVLLAWLLGIMISAFAVSLGAEFWFKLIGEVIRLTGKVPEKSPTSDK